MEHKTGTFGGKLKRATEQSALAEIYIRELGHGKAFGLGDFLSGTGIAKGSVAGLLLRLTEAGIIATYPHPKFANRNMYRVAWPVLISQGEPKPEAVAHAEKMAAKKAQKVSETPGRDAARVIAQRVAEKRAEAGERLLNRLSDESPLEGGEEKPEEAYIVELYGKGTEPLIVYTDIKAKSPEEAAQKARMNLRALVSLEWEL